MSGKFYNGSTQCHKIIHEALDRIRFQIFLNSLFPEETNNINGEVPTLKNLFPSREFENLLEQHAFRDIMMRYGVFIETKKKTCPTFAFWSSYIDISGKNIP